MGVPVTSGLSPLALNRPCFSPRSIASMNIGRVISPSSSTLKSASCSSGASGVELAKGPPTATGRPRCLALAIWAAMSAFWTIIPEITTSSAQFHSASVTSRTLRSTSFISQVWGSRAATVTMPSGGSSTLRLTSSRIFS